MFFFISELREQFEEHWLEQNLRGWTRILFSSILSGLITCGGVFDTARKSQQLEDPFQGFCRSSICGGVEFRRSTIPPWIFTVDKWMRGQQVWVRRIGGRELELVFSVP